MTAARLAALFAITFVVTVAVLIALALWFFQPEPPHARHVLEPPPVSKPAQEPPAPIPERHTVEPPPAKRRVIQQ
jgi:hypothetical protein